MENTKEKTAAAANQHDEIPNEYIANLLAQMHAINRQDMAAFVHQLLQKQQQHPRLQKVAEPHVYNAVDEEEANDNEDEGRFKRYRYDKR